MQSNEKNNDPAIEKLDRLLAAQDSEPFGLDHLATEEVANNDRMAELVNTILHLEQWGSQADISRAIGGEFPFELDGWRLRRVLGRGGSGIVFLGDREDEQAAAIKTIFKADSAHHGRWQREVHIISRLKHPHIIPLVASGETDGIPYVAMQLVDGASLADLIDRQRSSEGRAGTEPPPRTIASAVEPRLCLPQAQLFTATYLQRKYVRAALLAMADVADALQAAHSAGVIHRDVKPSNVLIERSGQVWLSDFGMASVQGDVTLTASGLTVGTLGYMSPEQAAGMNGDPRSDIYSLGVTALELLTLTAPLASLPWRSARQWWRSRGWAGSLPRRARRVLLKSISVDPQQRPSSAGEVARELRLAAREPAWSTCYRGFIAAAVICFAGFMCSPVGTKLWDQAFKAPETPPLNIDQETADAMRKDRIELLGSNPQRHSWEHEVARNSARLSIRFEARDDENRPIEAVRVGDPFWLVVVGESEVERDGDWQRAITFSIHGIMKAEPAGRFRVTGGPEWAAGYQSLNQEFKFFEPTCIAGPISGLAVDKRLYGLELGQIAVQEPLARLRCLALAAGDVLIGFELPDSGAGSSNTIRHVPRRLFDEEVSSSTLRLEIVEKSTN